MALTGKSLFLYGFQVTSTNRALDFRSVSGGPILYATLNLGFYSLTSLMQEIARAMNVADPSHTFTIEADRTFNAGLENRVTISSDSIYLDLLFGTGPRKDISIAPYIGFAIADRMGSNTYQGTVTAGTTLVPTLYAYNYISPEMNRKVFGSVNISASGEKEAIVFQVQRFFSCQFKYEPETKIKTEWMALMNWAIQQRAFEFTPNTALPTTFYECTLESTSADGKGLGYKFTEMLPNFPFLYDTGVLTFRQKVPSTGFL